MSAAGPVEEDVVGHAEDVAEPGARPARVPASPPPTQGPPTWLKLAPLAYLPVFLAWYFALEGRPAGAMFVVDSTLDALIPFDARWALGYFAWFPFLLGFVGWLLWRDFRSYAETPRLAFLLIVGMTACLIGYTLCSTTQTLRPDVYPDQGWFTSVVAGLQGFDDPSNVFPSLHVYTSLVVAYCLVVSGYVRSVWVKLTGIALTVLIALSTAFLKQHSIVDAFGSAALFLLVLGAWALLPRRRG